MKSLRNILLLSSSLFLLNACGGADPEVCNDGIDNDADGVADCDDVDDCSAAINCQVEICNNTIDDNANGVADCSDLACANDPACLPELNCTDGTDNDSDGSVDCDDTDCFQSCAPPLEDCTNGVDDDGDSSVDCADTDCSQSASCVEQNCTDNTDNDQDGLTDCQDGDCAQDPSCAAQGGTQIQDVQDGTILTDAVVTVENVFVTAIRIGANNGNLSIFLQEPQGQTTAGHAYPEFAGVQLFVSAFNDAAVLPSFNNLQVGDCVSVTASTTEFNNGTELKTPTAFSINPNPASCGAVPQPFVIPGAQASFADVCTDADANTLDDQAGVKAEVFEGILVELRNVTAQAAVDANGDFRVTAGGTETMLIENFLFSGNNTPLVANQGQSFSKIIGIYNEFNNFRVQPRSAADLVP